MSKVFVFDCDGTLTDKKGNLNEGVVELFAEIVKKDSDARFMICSGNSLEEIKDVAKAINKGLSSTYGVKNNIKFNYAPYAGSMIVDESGKIVRDNRLNENVCAGIINDVTSIDPKAIALIRSKFGLFYKAPKTFSKQNVKIALLKLLMKVKPVGDFKTESLNDAEFKKQIESNSVYTMEVLSLSSSLNKQITKELATKYADLTVSPGFTVQVSANSKMSAITEVFGEDLSEVVYMGDGYNDIEPLSRCGLSFALGNKSKVLKSATYALNNFSDAKKVLYDGLDYSQKSKEVIHLAELKEEEKKQKKEMGRIKYSIKKLTGGNKEQEKSR